MRRTFPTIPLLLISCCAVPAQPTDSKPEFEAASVKVSPPIEMLLPLVRQGTIRLGMNGGPGTNDPGRFSTTAATLSILITRAYNIKRYQLSGPGWLDSELYDIVAKVPEGTTTERFTLMLRNLLEERFKIGLHKESKEVVGYEVKVGKGGPKLIESSGTPPKSDGAPLSSNASATDRDGFPVLPQSMTSGSISRSGRTSMKRAKTTMDEFADTLTGMLGRPVTDATGLNGRYDIILRYVRDVPGSTAVQESSTDGEPTLFSAVQSQLGLKLESKKVTIELLVIDHVEKTPTRN